jgi:hypothetical protein
MDIKTRIILWCKLLILRLFGIDCTETPAVSKYLSTTFGSPGLIEWSKEASPKRIVI